MTILETYTSFLQLVNRNATNNNLNVDQARFVIMFREAELSFYDLILSTGRKDKKIREVSHLLVPRKALTLDNKYDTYDDYTLPKDYFDFSSLHVRGAENSKVADLLATEVKSDDIEEVLNDEFTRPSFLYRETVYHLSENNKVTIYKRKFDIEDVRLTYYRLPRQVDIAGYTRTDGTQSTQNIDPEWDDKSINQILLFMTKGFSAVNSDTNSYQLSKDRLSEGLQ